MLRDIPWEIVYILCMAICILHILYYTYKIYTYDSEDEINLRVKIIERGINNLIRPEISILLSFPVINQL